MFPAFHSPSPLEDADADRAPWTPRDTALGVVLTLGPLIAFSIYNMIAARGTGNVTRPFTPQEDLTIAIVQFIITAALEAVFLIAPIYYARKRAGTNALQALGMRPFHPGMAIGLLILSAAGVHIGSAIYDAIASLLRFTIQTNVDPLVSELKQAPLVVYASLLVAVIVAPICEELFFRGFLLQGLRQSLPAWAAIGVSSLIFAAAHLSLGSFPILLILAIFLGILRVATRSIWPGVILHTLNNLLSLLYVLTLKH